MNRHFVDTLPKRILLRMVKLSIQSSIDGHERAAVVYGSPNGIKIMNIPFVGSEHSLEMFVPTIFPIYCHFHTHPPHVFFDDIPSLLDIISIARLKSADRFGTFQGFCIGLGSLLNPTKVGIKCYHVADWNEFKNMAKLALSVITQGSIIPPFSEFYDKLEKDVCVVKTVFFPHEFLRFFT